MVGLLAKWRIVHKAHDLEAIMSTASERQTNLRGPDELERCGPYWSRSDCALQQVAARYAVAITSAVAHFIHPNLFVCLLHPQRLKRAR
jgi:hypothetical protein